MLFIILDQGCFRINSTGAEKQEYMCRRCQTSWTQVILIIILGVFLFGSISLNVCMYFRCKRKKVGFKGDLSSSSPLLPSEKDVRIEMQDNKKSENGNGIVLKSNRTSKKAPEKRRKTN
mmetsp:Transcript_40128/g.64792  ORF Transcript_40128/g.64792 Transcript_40128/m.64792 type:complete len:119 (+) Transcript_40128:105-461(+)